MSDDSKNIFNIEKQTQDQIIEYVKKQWKFFFGFFLGVVAVLLLN